MKNILKKAQHSLPMVVVGVFVVGLGVFMLAPKAVNAATTVLSDNFNDGVILDDGWSANYFETPDSNGISTDVRAENSGDYNNEGYSAKIDDDVAIYHAINTTGYQNIKFTYCRKTTSVNTGDILRVGWKTGSVSTNWSNWTEIEAYTHEDSWECTSFDVPSSANNTNIQIAFFIDAEEADYGWVDNVKVEGDALPYCGDRIKNGDEDCDGTDGVGAHQSCRVDCTLKNLTYCGDGIKQSTNEEDVHEQCDGSDGVGAHQRCNASCHLVNLTYCGDGIKQSTNGEGVHEDCDGGPSGNATCNSDCTWKPATISAAKVICNSEADLPNWGDHGSVIGATTAADYVAASGGKCRLSEWNFQWAYDYVDNPGNNSGAQSTPWQTFTNTTQISNLSNDKIWLREVWDNQYVPFSGDYTKPFDTVSAEFYCNGDTLNYDNYEWIDNLNHGQTYYCVAFNALAAYCGDGNVDPGEDCDGNTTQSCKVGDYNGQQTCNMPVVGKLTINGVTPAPQFCTWNPCQPTEYCGDDIINGTEQCDGDQPKACITAEGYAGTQTCYMGNTNNNQAIGVTTFRLMCIWDSCQTQEFCGDNIVNGLETCDEGQSLNGQPNHCNATCNGTTTPVCGNETVEIGEECDFSSPKACTTAEGYAGTQSCFMGNPEAQSDNQPWCTWMTCLTGEKCGDGIKNGSEACDDGNTVDDDMCKNDCTTNSYTCGNAILQVDLGEVCDDGNVVSGDGCSATCTIEEPLKEVIPTPSITLAKSDTPDPVKAGENITYKLDYTVAGTLVNNLSLVDTLPANTTFVSATNSGIYDNASKTVTWNLGTVLVGSYSVGLVVKVDGVLANGTILTNTATLSGTGVEPKTATQKTTVNSAATLSVVKSVEKSPVYPGDKVNYIVTIKNNGSDTAINLRLADTMPAGFTYDDGSAGSWFFGNLAVGAEKNFIYSVTVGTSVVPGTYTNTAQVSADNVSAVKVTADLAVIAKPGVVLGAETEGTVAAAETTLPKAGSSIVSYLIVLVGLSGLAYILKK